MSVYKDDYQKYLTDMTELLYSRLQTDSSAQIDRSYLKPLIKDLLNLQLILVEKNSFPKMKNFRQQSRIGRTRDKDIQYLVEQPDPEIQNIFKEFLAGS